MAIQALPLAADLHVGPIHSPASTHGHLRRRNKRRQYRQHLHRSAMQRGVIDEERPRSAIISSMCRKLSGQCNRCTTRRSASIVFVRSTCIVRKHRSAVSRQSRQLSCSSTRRRVILPGSEPTLLPDALPAIKVSFGDALRNEEALSMREAESPAFALLTRGTSLQPEKPLTPMETARPCRKPPPQPRWLSST